MRGAARWHACLACSLGYCSAHALLRICHLLPPPPPTPSYPPTLSPQVFEARWVETPVACKVLTTCDSDDIETLQQAAAALATSATLLAKLEEVGGACARSAAQCRAAQPYVSPCPAAASCQLPFASQPLPHPAGQQKPEARSWRLGALAECRFPQPPGSFLPALKQLLVPA